MTQNIHICQYCHIKIKKEIQELIKPSIEIDINNIHSKERCYICERYITSIINNNNIITYIELNKNKSSIDELILNISRYRIWYYNDIYDNFGYDLKNRFNFNHNQLKNIYQAITDLYALPTQTIIDNKADDLYMELQLKLKKKLFILIHDYHN